MKLKQWNKQCKCEKFIPDEWDLCDNCLLAKYNLTHRGRYSIDDSEGLGSKLYKEIDVLDALRRAEDEGKEYKAILGDFAHRAMTLDILTCINKLGDEEEVDAQKISDDLGYKKEKVEGVLKEFKKH